jgi:hypothetical protein
VPPVDRELIMTDRHEHLDEGTIHAWLDEALTPDESARVESAASSCADCAAMVAEARGLIAASSRILSSLDAVPAGVIPGKSANVDQLAALRARQRASTRRWWQDGRVAIAASLMLVAGVSSLVLRSNGGERLQVAADTAGSVPAIAPAPAPAAPTPGTSPTESRQANERDAKVVSAPPPSAERTREAAAVRMDSSTAQKVAAASSPVVGAVANEARLARRADTGTVGRIAVDSIAPQRREVAERQLRQEGTRQAVQQAPAPSALAPGVQRRAIVPTGVGAAMADAAAAAPACYRVRGLTAPAITDTIRLLNEQAPVLSDPAWFRTQIYGALRDTTLAWRSIDLVTIELRARFGSDTTAVRFRTDGAAPENRAVDGVRTASAMRVACPN